MPQPAATSPRYRQLLLALLFLLALFTRTERALQQPVVNPDAIRFIDQARQLPAAPLRALRGEVYHPLHAVAALGVHTLIRSWFSDDRMAWLAAVQSVGVVCGAIVALQIISISRFFGAPLWAAVGASLAWTVGRRTSAYGADGLSDMLFLCLFAAAMLTAMRAMRFRGASLSRAQTQDFALTGFIAGLAYLARPEGLAAPLIVLATLLALTIRHRKASPRGYKLLPKRPLPLPVALHSAACLLLGLAVPALPYMVAIGGVTQKKPIDFHMPAALVPWSLSASGPAAEVSRSALEKISMELLETFGFAPWIALGGAMLLQPRFWGRPRVRPLVIIWALLWSTVMVWLIHRASYLDGRHTLPLQLLLHGLLALGFVAWTRPMRWWMNWWRRKPAWDRLPAWMRWPQWPYLFAACAIGLTLLPGVLRLSQPPQEEQQFVRDAARWVQENLRPEVVVWDRPRLVGYYAGHPYRQWLGSPNKLLLDQIDTRTPCVVGYVYRPGLKEPPQLHLGPLQAIAAFASKTALHGDILVLYALPNAPIFKGVAPGPLTTLPDAVIVR